MNIILIGFRCAGKSTVGALLARKLGRPFVDSDDYIERKTGLSIREIFEIAGEQYFRLLEGDALADLSKFDNQVIATGGGAALKYKNIRNLKRNGILIYLEATPQSILERIEKDEKTGMRRPSLTGQDPSLEVPEQLQIRRPYYLSAADTTIPTDQKPTETIVQEILDWLKERGVGGATDDTDTAIA